MNDHTILVFGEERIKVPILSLTYFYMSGIFPANIYLFKVNDRNTTKRCVISSKLIKTLIINFEHISHFSLVFL